MAAQRLAALAATVGCAEWQAKAASQLLLDGLSVPFVARYRAHVVGDLSPPQLRMIDDALRDDRALTARREAMKRSLSAADPSLLTDALAQALDAAPTIKALEALYEPFKGKRDTLASRARDAGFGLVGDALWAGSFQEDNALRAALDKVTTQQTRTTAKDMLVHVVAENMAKDEGVRAAALAFGESQAMVSVRGAKGAAPADAANFRDYVGTSVPLRRVRPHSWLAIQRGVAKGALKVAVTLPGPAEPPGAVRRVALERAGVPRGSWRSQVVHTAVDDAWTRLLKRWCLTAAQRQVTEQARTSALDCFDSNLRQLLRQAPVRVERPGQAPGRPDLVLGVDPGYKHGHKCAVVDGTTGAVVTSLTIPAASGSRRSGGDGEHEPTVQALVTLMRTHAVDVIAVGDGQGTHLARAAAQRAAKAVPSNPRVVVISEAGASVYSASETACEELASVPVAERGAVTLARRCVDPLNEFVKVKPESLAVGMYQHDMPSSDLAKRLTAAVEDVVAEVGVDVNAASPWLLARVSGLGRKVAEQIHRRVQTTGPFKARRDLLEVAGLGPKAYQNAAGFLRVDVPDIEPLDRTRVHPELYDEAEALLREAGLTSEAIAMKGAAAVPENTRARWGEIAAQAAGGRSAAARCLADPFVAGDPRAAIAHEALRVAEPPTALEDIKVGQLLRARVQNVVPFGAFCDVGAASEALLPASAVPASAALPAEGLVLGVTLEAVVTAVDIGRGRLTIGLAASTPSATIVKKRQPDPTDRTDAPRAKAPRCTH